MTSERTSPTYFKRKFSAVLFVFIVGVLLTAGVYAGINLLKNHDFSDCIPEDASLRARLIDPETGYIAVAPDQTPAALMTGAPARDVLEPTPIPIDLYSTRNARMVMPQAAAMAAPCAGGVISFETSSADDNKAVTVTGWACLEGMDAMQSKIYLVVSSQNAAVNRFYDVTVLPGCTGDAHASVTGQNLERADFRAVFSVQIYDDGPYRLSALVVSGEGKNKVQGLIEYDENYHFYVRNKTIMSVG